MTPDSILTLSAANRLTGLGRQPHHMEAESPSVSVTSQLTLSILG